MVVLLRDPSPPARFGMTRAGGAIARARRSHLADCHPERARVKLNANLVASAFRRGATKEHRQDADATISNESGPE